MGASQAFNEMVLKCLDGLFGNVVTMHMWRIELEFFIALVDELMECKWCFIAKDMGYNSEATLNE